MGDQQKPPVMPQAPAPTPPPTPPLAINSNWNGYGQSNGNASGASAPLTNTAGVAPYTPSGGAGLGQTPMSGFQPPAHAGPQQYTTTGIPGDTSHAVRTDFGHGPGGQPMDRTLFNGKGPVVPGTGQPIDRSFASNYYYTLTPAQKVAFSMLSPDQQSAQLSSAMQNTWNTAPTPAPGGAQQLPNSPILNTPAAGY